MSSVLHWSFKKYSISNVKLKSVTKEGIVTLEGSRKEIIQIGIKNTFVKLFILPPNTQNQNISKSFTSFHADLTTDGINRNDFKYFISPVSVKENKLNIIISNNKLELIILKNSFFKINWFYKAEDLRKIAIFEDASLEPYIYYENDLSQTMGFSHFIQSSNDHEVYGIGESSGDLNKVGKRVTFYCTDSMGYDAKRSTYSMYKHFPMYFVKHKDINFGILYDDLHLNEIDLNHQISAFRGQTFKFTTNAPYLDVYFSFPKLIASNSIHDLVSTFGQYLLGRPILPPAWSLGYNASSMIYSDAVNAQERLESFGSECKIKNQIPCSGFYLSSGYTMNAKKERHVFNWSDRISSPKKMTDSFNDFKIKIIPNLKPWYLITNPKFNEAENKQVFINEKLYFWKGLPGTYEEGKYFDFRKDEAREYWKSQINKQLIEKCGEIHGLWNDNNEYEVSASVLLEKSLQSVLMARTSLQALNKQHEDVKISDRKRYLVVSRAGGLGIHRHAAQTWSGDNRTTWETMRYNILMSLSLSLSLWVGCSFDIGGFTGKKCSEELLVRWCEVGLFFPRFTIHSSSWKDKFEVNSPWMYPNSTEYIRKLIQFRHQLIPYLMSCYVEAHLKYKPVVTSPFFVSSKGSGFYEKSNQFNFLLGSNLFIAPIVYPAAEFKRDVSWKVRFPHGDEEWIDFQTGEVYQGGQEYQLNYMEQEKSKRKLKIPFFQRAKSCIVLQGDFLKADFMNGENQVNKPHVYVLGCGKFSVEWFEVSQSSLHEFILFSIEVKSTSEEIIVLNFTKKLITVVSHDSYMKRVAEPGDLKNIVVRCGCFEDKQIKQSIEFS